MPSGTFLVNGDGTGPRDWASQASTAIDEAVGTGTDTVNAQASTTSSPAPNNNDTSFTLDNVASTLARMDTVSFKVRYRVAGRDTSNPDTFGLYCRIVQQGSPDVVLAAGDSGGAFQAVDADIQQTGNSPSFLTSSTIAFSYVNPAPLARSWNGAEVEFRQTWTLSGINDNGQVQVESCEFPYMYTEATLQSTGGGSTATLKSRAAANSTASAATATEKALAAAKSLAAVATATQKSRASGSSLAAVATARVGASAAATSTGSTSTATHGATAAAKSDATSTASALGGLVGRNLECLGSTATATLAALAGGLSTGAIADTELGARTSGTSGGAATALAAAQAAGTADATSTAEVNRQSSLDSAATATASLGAAAGARATGQATGALTGGSLATAEGAATALVSAAASGFAAATTTASRLVPAAAGSSDAQASAELLTGFVSCHAVSTATLGSQATARADGVSASAIRAQAAAGAQGAASCVAAPRSGLSVVASAQARISPNPLARSSASASATATGSSGEAGFVVWGATNGTPPAPLGTLEYKLDKANYGYALASLKWNNYQYLANGAGKMLLRTVLPGDVVEIATDIAAEADFHTVGTYEVHTETKATDLVSRWRRNIVGRLGLPDMYANVLHVHWVAAQEKNTVTNPVAGLPNMPPGESEAPHARFEVPELLLVAPLGSVMYLYDAENDIATPRTELIEDLPAIGGPICSTLDATKAIGLFRRGTGQVKWDPSSNVALSLLFTQVEGISSQKGPKFGDFWLVLGTLGEVEEAFIALKDTLASAKRQVVEVSGVSPVAAAPISL